MANVGVRGLPTPTFSGSARENRLGQARPVGKSANLGKDMATAEARWRAKLSAGFDELLPIPTEHSSSLGANHSPLRACGRASANGAGAPPEEGRPVQFGPGFSPDTRHPLKTHPACEAPARQEIAMDCAATAQSHVSLQARRRLVPACPFRDTRCLTVEETVCSPESECRSSCALDKRTLYGTKFQSMPSRRVSVAVACVRRRGYRSRERQVAFSREELPPMECGHEHAPSLDGRGGETCRLWRRPSGSVEID